MKRVLLLITALIFISCGKSADEKISSDIDRANTLLTSRQCGGAIDLLEGMGRKGTNPYYVVTLASAYACRAEYSSIKFFADDIALTSTDDSVLGGLTLYSTADETISAPFSTDSKVVDYQSGIDVLLYAGGNIASTTEPTYARRLSIYGNDAGDVNSFAMYLILNQLGKYLRYYGNGNATAVKGGGTFGNTCFTDYGNAPVAVQTAITTAGETGSCVTINDGHSELSSAVAAATRKARLCQGVVLVNNLIELLPSVLADASGTDLDSINDVLDDIEAAKTQLEVLVPGIGNVLTVQSQENCEDDTTITMGNLESYFAAMMETSFK